MKAVSVLQKTMMITGLALCMSGYAFAQNADTKNVPGAAKVDQTPAGKIQVVDSYDWGDVKVGDLKTTIEIKNVGKGELKISGVRPSCGCTTAPIDKDVLKPGETAKVDVTLKASHPGALQKTITLTSTDPEAATKIIYLKANVRQDVTFLPNSTYILLNDAKVGVETTSSIRVKNTGEQPFTVFRPEVNEANVTAKYDMPAEVVVKPGDDYDIVVRMTPQEQGAVHGKLKIKTSNAETPSTEFYIYGNVIAEAVTAPAATPSTPPVSDAPSMSNKK